MEENPEEVVEVDTSGAVEETDTAEEATETAPTSSTPSYRSDNGKKGECIPKVFNGEGNQDTGGESYWGLFIIAFL